ncbi:MAG: DUF3370 domain-containing protein [Scytolyngbya sp. HA4215-MV1]|jgi:hypothetical protein|nr:DUF3370 domain-containing protein [Scytolyngbya sp. HA4215-MV1]
MFSFLPLFTLAQATPTPPPQEVFQPQEVRPLPGQLDSVLVFNSNSPELVLKEGILLSTFPPKGKTFPAAHLNQPLSGRFDVFAHHIAKAPTPEDLRTLYLGVLLYNPGKQAITIDILQAASYLSQPDAPFIDLPPMVDDPQGTVYAGPGSRAMGDILRGRRQAGFPPQVIIPPGESRLLMNLPIPVKTLTPPLNGRSTLIRARSNGTFYAASLAMFAKPTAEGNERPPTLEEWQNLLETGDLASPRDRTPTPPGAKGQIVYGRVAGVARGSAWDAQIFTTSTYHLPIPPTGQAYSYGLSTLLGGKLGTGQDQTADLIARYPDTAYKTHGNYAIQYNLTLPLQNPTDQPQTVTLTIQTPTKQEQIQGGLKFFDPPQRQVFFRGTVRFRYNDDLGAPQTRYVHLVQRRGQQGEPIVTLTMPPGSDRLVQVDFLYPPDATPPQVLTVRTQ